MVAALLANSGHRGHQVRRLAAHRCRRRCSPRPIHSVADAGNQALLLLGGKRRPREATAEHPFGFGRERYIYAFIVSIVLFSVGGLFALYEAYHKYHEVHAGDPTELLDGRWWWVPLRRARRAIVMEAFSFRTAIVESNKVRGDGDLVASSSASAKRPELPVVLLEDLAALLGLVFALVGVSPDAAPPRTATSTSPALPRIGILLVVVAVVLGHRDQEPAAGRVRDAGGHQGRSAAALDGRRRRSTA
ncbi:MAG: cation transporter [Nocardioidaceae bacterium]